MAIEKRMISAIMAATMGVCVLSGCNGVESSETEIETEIENGDVTGDIAMSEMAENMVGRFSYDYKLYPEGTDYESILDEYEELVKAGEREGFTPVIVPVDSTLEDFWGILYDDGYSVEEALKAAEAEVGKSFLQQCYKEFVGDGADAENELIGTYVGESDKISSFYALSPMIGDTGEIIIFKVPTTKPWEVVAYLPFGGWNDCPKPEKMAAVCKYWYDKYGAVPVTITHDILEMSVPKPVNQMEALELAKEHFAFDPDRVYQATSSFTISEVASSLSVSNVWFFWWD